MAASIRKICSKNKRRYKDKDYDLDLSYILPNVIAMGFPAKNLEAVFRNHIDKVSEFLKERHSDHFKIYNLCDEDKNYDEAKFANRVEKYPFRDHQPPKLKRMLPFCENVHEWLKACDQNVVAIHCKAGKGRTGVMICAYLLFTGECKTAEEALSFYGNKRTVDTNGVTIPSQRCYVHYFSRIIRENLIYHPKKMLLKSIRFDGAFPNGLHPHSFKVYVNAEKRYRSPIFEFPRGTTFFLMNLDGDGVEVEEDVKVIFSCKPNLVQAKEKIFSFWFNTFLICPSSSSVCMAAAAKNGLINNNYTATTNERVSNVNNKDADTSHISNGCESTGDLNSGATSAVSGTIINSDNSNSKSHNTLNSDKDTNGLVSPSSSSTSSSSSYSQQHLFTLNRDELDAEAKEKFAKYYSPDFKIYCTFQCCHDRPSGSTGGCGLIQAVIDNNTGLTTTTNCNDNSNDDFTDSFASNNQSDKRNSDDDGRSAIPSHLCSSPIGGLPIPRPNRISDDSSESESSTRSETDDDEEEEAADEDQSLLSTEQSSSCAEFDSAQMAPPSVAVVVATTPAKSATNAAASKNDSDSSRFTTKSDDEFQHRLTLNDKDNNDNIGDHHTANNSSSAPRPNSRCNSAPTQNNFFVVSPSASSSSRSPVAQQRCCTLDATAAESHHHQGSAVHSMPDGLLPPGASRHKNNNHHQHRPRGIPSGDLLL